MKYAITNHIAWKWKQFRNEYSDVIFIQMDNIWKSYCKNTKVSRFSESRCRVQIWGVKVEGQGDWER